MRIEKVNILKICNWSHPDFGVFTKFLDGLSHGKEYVEVPQNILMGFCEKCNSVYSKDFGVCITCAVIKKNKSVILLDHAHTWTIEQEKDHCIKCGIFKDYFEKPSNPSESTDSIEKT